MGVQRWRTKLGRQAAVSVSVWRSLYRPPSVFFFQSFLVVKKEQRLYIFIKIPLSLAFARDPTNTRRARPLPRWFVLLLGMNARKDKRLACAYEGFTCAVFVKNIGTFVDRCNSETIGVGDPVEDIRVNKASLFHVSSHARRVESRVLHDFSLRSFHDFKNVLLYLFSTLGGRAN